jgi:hypothetical protein
MITVKIINAHSRISARALTESLTASKEGCIEEVASIRIQISIVLDSGFFCGEDTAPPPLLAVAALEDLLMVAIFAVTGATVELRNQSKYSLGS